MEVGREGRDPVDKRKVLIDVCRTRWAARHDVYRHLYTAYVLIVKALKLLLLACTKEDYSGNVTTGWEAKYRTEASGILTGIEQFEFVSLFSQCINTFHTWKVSLSNCRVLLLTSFRLFTW